VVLPSVQPPMANNPAFPGVQFLVIRG
jgi:hypothetical protein